ncbi:MAG: UDP-N-acetylglucosamine 4,6-dehydratase family protein, partial [Chloroflexota bacterium]
LGRKSVGWHEAVDVSPVREKVVLVTGAAGSIGSELCRQILSYAPVKLILLDNNESGLHDLLTELATRTRGDSLLVPALADITDARQMRALFAAHQPQLIFHSAAYKHVPMLEAYPSESIRVNIGGTRLVAELAHQHGAERFVLISTDKAVNPSSIMGASKRICEMLMHAFAQRGGATLFTSVRFGNVLGSRGSVVPTFERQIQAGGPVTVTDPEMTRYFMTIPEAVNLVIHAACLTQGDDLFMLQMGQVVRIVELAERMIRMCGLRPYIDIAIDFTGVRPGEKLHEELHTDAEHQHPTMHPDIVQLVNTRNGHLHDHFVAELDELVRSTPDQETARQRVLALAGYVPVSPQA